MIIIKTTERLCFK